MGMLARLGVVLALDSAEFKSGIESADRAITSFQAKLPTMGAAAAAAFTAMTYKALAYSDAISDTAKANDMAIASVMALGEGLAQNGGEAENAGKLLASFTAKVDEAAQGSLDAQKAFGRLGITLKDLGSKDITGLFDQTIEALAKMDDTLSRNALAMTMFGKAAKGVDFKGLAEGTAEARKEFEDYAKAVEIAGDLHDKLDAKATKTLVLFTNAFLPTLDKLYDAFASDTKGMEMLMDAGEVTIKFLAEGFYDIYTAVMMLVEGTKFLKNALIDIFTLKGFKGILADYEVMNDRTVELINNAKKFHDALWDKSKPEGKQRDISGGRKVTPAKDPAAEKIAQMLAMAKLISGEYERHLKFNLANLKTQGEMAFMTDNQRKIQEAINKVADDTDKKLDEIQKKREEAAAHGADKTVIAELDRQAEAVKALGDAYQKLSEEEIKSQIAAQSTFEFGWNKAFSQYAEDSENAAKRAQDTFQTLTGNMNSAIDNFVKTGKLSFSNLAKSIIQDLIAIQLKAQASSIFSSMFGAFKMGTGSGQFESDINVSGFRADGGSVGANNAYVVGERGPELFVPQGAGTIIPNNRMQSNMGSGQTINNFNINAIDTKSFEQRLFNSSNAIWAANQYANKSLAAVGGRS